MHEAGFQLADFAARNFHIGVIAIVGVATQLAAEQPQYVVRVPAAVLDLITEKMIAAQNAITVFLRSVQRAADFRGQFRRHALVGVDNQHPRARGLRNGPILEVSGIDILTLDDPAAQRTGDLEGAVGGTGISDQDFVGHFAGGLDTGSDVQPFIFARYENRQLPRHAQRPRTRHEEF